MEYKIYNYIEAKDIVYLRDLLGWKKVSEEQFVRSLKNTMCSVSIKNDDDVIAVGRVVGDYYTKGLLSDILVNPKYQGMGYGKIIINNLLEQIKDNLNTGDLFMLEASPTCGNRDFYVKCGLKYKPENQDGVYVWIEKE
mgnify:FL=1